MDETLRSLRNSYSKLKSAERMITDAYRMTNNHRLLLSAAIMVNESIKYLADHIEGDGLREGEEGNDAASILKQSGFASEDDMKSFLDEISELMRYHEGSAMEFSRGECFVICRNDLDFVKICEKDVERFISYARLLLERVGARVIVENG